MDLRKGMTVYFINDHNPCTEAMIQRVNPGTVTFRYADGRRLLIHKSFIHIDKCARCPSTDVPNDNP